VTYCELAQHLVLETRVLWVQVPPKLPMPKVQITERKLGRIKDKPLGLAWTDTGEIEIDPRQLSKDYLDTLIHEIIHVELPDLPETKVRKLANIISREVWKKKYRRIMD
jgi:hypothetical protein